MPRILLLTISLITIIGAIAYWKLSPATAPASQAFIGGHVITLDEEEPSAEAVLLRGEYIAAVGNKSEILALVDDDTVIHQLQGKTLLPGFIDAHGHFPGSGLSAVAVDLNSPPIGNVTSMAQLIDKLVDKANAQKAGQWLFAYGYDDTLLEEKRHPHRDELDAALPNTPVFLMHISGHMGVANSRALALAGINEDSPDPVGGSFKRDASGNLNGLLEENAAITVQEIAMDYSVGDFLKMVDHAAAEYGRAGVTTAQSGGIDSRMAMGLKIASLLNKIPLRLELWPIYNELGSDLLSGKKSAADFETDKIHLGAVKIVADGSIQGYTGYLSTPYHTPHHNDADYRGYPRIPREELFSWVEKFHRGGFQLAIHGNGDAAIDDIIDAFAEAQRLHPVDDPRLILVHAQMARDDQLARMKTLGITPSFFSAHTYYWGDRHRDIFIGNARAERISPARSAEELQLPYTAHLDTPVVPMNPLQAVWSTANRLSTSGQLIGAEQRVEVLSALRATTLSAAWQIGREAEIGSIKVGKLADLVVLRDNPLDPTQRQRINEIDVMATYVGGVEIFRRKNPEGNQ